MPKVKVTVSMQADGYHALSPTPTSLLSEVTDFIAFPHHITCPISLTHNTYSHICSFNKPLDHTIIATP